MDDDLVIETTSDPPPEKTFDQAVQDAMDQLADEAFQRQLSGNCPYGLTACRCIGPAYCNPRRTLAHD